MIEKYKLYTRCPMCNEIIEIVQGDFDFEYNDEYPDENGVWVTNTEVSIRCKCSNYFRFDVPKERSQGEPNPMDQILETGLGKKVLSSSFRKKK